MMYRYKATHCGWFAFEGFGRPFEAWTKISDGGWVSHGRAFTYKGAKKKAKRYVKRAMDDADL